jgi:hypothetical protein
MSSQFVRLYGVTGAAVSYCGVTVLFILPVGTAVLLKCRRQWRVCVQ